MKLDVTQVLMRLDDPTKPMITAAKTLEDGEENPDSKPLTLRFVLVESLLAAYKDETSLSQEKKLRRWHLANKIQRQEAVELTVQDRTLCQQLVLKMFGLAIAGQAYDLLDVAPPEDVPEKAELKLEE